MHLFRYLSVATILGAATLITPVSAERKSTTAAFADVPCAQVAAELQGFHRASAMAMMAGMFTPEQIREMGGQEGSPFESVDPELVIELSQMYAQIIDNPDEDPDESAAKEHWRILASVLHEDYRARVLPVVRQTYEKGGESLPNSTTIAYLYSMCRAEQEERGIHSLDSLLSGRFNDDLTACAKGSTGDRQAWNDCVSELLLR